MSYENKLDPMYFICAPYYHDVVDAEYETCRASDFLPTDVRESMSELSALDYDNENDVDLELPDLRLETTGTSWARALSAPKKGTPAEAGEPATKPEGLAMVEALFLQIVADDNSR